MTARMAPLADPLDLAAAVSLLLDNHQIEPLDILWRTPAGTIFVGPLPEPLDLECDPIGFAIYWVELLQPEPAA
jgi:hypothetical protein